MELSSPESIRALIATFGNPKRVPRRHSVPDATMPARRSGGMRCKCQQCHQCRENARWERIFAEKFADPAYYSNIVIHRASPLTSI
jgi:hypothetical protein